MYRNESPPFLNTLPEPLPPDGTGRDPRFRLSAERQGPGHTYADQHSCKCQNNYKYTSTDPARSPYTVPHSGKAEDSVSLGGLTEYRMHWMCHTNICTGRAASSNQCSAYFQGCSNPRPPIRHPHSRPFQSDLYPQRTSKRQACYSFRLLLL